jgi:hypothetical protein
MTIYQPGIPTGTVPFNLDYQNIQNNFQQLDTSFGQDHIPFSQALNNGYHKAVRLVPQAAPAQVVGIGQLFDTSVNDGYNTDTELFFKTGGDLLIQLTRNFVPAPNQNGYTFIPGGLILQWGIVNNPSSSGTVTFATSNIAFASNLFGVWFNFSRNASSTDSFWIDSTKTFDKTKFSWKASTSSANFLYWIAIGK